MRQQASRTRPLLPESNRFRASRFDDDMPTPRCRSHVACLIVSLRRARAGRLLARMSAAGGARCGSTSTMRGTCSCARASAPTLAEVRALDAAYRAKTRSTRFSRDARTAIPSMSPPGWTTARTRRRCSFRVQAWRADERKALRAQRDARRSSSCAAGGSSEMRDDAVAAHRADDAVLAQPLRVRASRRCAIRASCTSQNALFRAKRSAISARCCTPSRAIPAMLIWLDSGRNRTGRAERELRARSDGALHARRRALHASATSKAPRARSPAGAVDRAAAHACSGRACTTTASRRCSARAATSTATAPSTCCSRSRRPRVHRRPSSGASSSRPSPTRPRSRASPVRFRASHYDDQVALRALLLSDAFWDAKNRGTLVKSPVELVVGTLRHFDLRSGDTRPIAASAPRMGQNLFAPPNVSGWPGGDAGSTARRCSRARRSSPGPARRAAGCRRDATRVSMRDRCRSPMQRRLDAVGGRRRRLAAPVAAAAAIVGRPEAAAERDRSPLIRAAMLDPVLSTQVTMIAMPMRRRRFIGAGTFTALPLTGIASLAIGGCAQASAATGDDARPRLRPPRRTMRSSQAAPRRGANRAGYGAC